MSVIRLLAFVLCVTSEVQAALECLTCDPGTDRDACHKHHHCHSHEVCATHVTWYNGRPYYGFFCQDERECAQRQSIIGKRYLAQSDLYQQLCHQCCDHNRCNKDLCHMVFNQHTTTHHTNYPVPEPGRLVCLHCINVKDPSTCRETKTCNPNQVCYTAVYHNSHTGENDFVTGCREPHHYCATGRELPYNMLCHGCCHHTQYCNRHMCSQYVQHTPTPMVNTQTTPLVSTQTTPTVTKSTVLPPIVTVNLTVTNATTTSMASFTNTTMIATTTATTAAMTKTNASHQQPTYTDSCRDLEEDGLTCASLDFHHLCSDPSAFAYFLSRRKCPKYCGFCTPSTNVQINSVNVTLPPGNMCTDFEQDGFACDQLDIFHLCSGPTTLAYVVAQKKCRKYCGFCQPASTTIPTTKQTSTISTSKPTSAIPTTKQTSAIPTTKQTSTTPTTKPTSTIPTTKPTSTTPTTKQTSTIPTTKATSTIPTTKATSTIPTTKATSTIPTTKPTSTIQQTTGSVGCTDIEDQTFNCTEWTSHGYCLPFPGIGYETAKMRCRKHCGFCH